MMEKISSWIADSKINKVLSATWNDSQTKRSRITSGILTSKWKSLSSFIDLPLSLSHDLVLSQAEEAVECGGPETLPSVMSCLKHSLHREESLERVEELLNKTFSQCFEHRKSELFWSSIKQFVTLTFSGKMMAREDLSKILNCVSLIFAALITYVTFLSVYRETVRAKPDNCWSIQLDT
jgi:hypothetical protein